MSEIELKACPFCGKKPRFKVEPESWGYHSGSVEVACSCSATAGYQRDCSKRKKAAGKWNTRAPQWQPISSAPKDGTFYLATNGKDQRVENCPDGHVAGIWHRIDGDWRGVALGDDSTHWQPLPAPPEVEG